jgi:hypothetical protein
MSVEITSTNLNFLAGTGTVSGNRTGVTVSVKVNGGTPSGADHPSSTTWTKDISFPPNINKVTITATANGVADKGDTKTVNNPSPVVNPGEGGGAGSGA